MSLATAMPSTEAAVGTALPGRWLTALCMLQVSSKRLAGLNKGLRGCKVGNFEYVGAGLNLGQQLGEAYRLLPLTDCPAC